MGVPPLDLRVIAADGYLEEALVEVQVQAAEVCFDRHHSSPVELAIRSDLSDTDGCQIRWGAISERRRNSYANTKDATELGAYAVSLAVLRSFCQTVTVKRAPQLSGSDYIIIPSGDLDFERASRLEVSGTSSEDPKEVLRRLSNKLIQLMRGASDLPGLASVVSFRTAQVLMESPQA